MKTVNEVFDKIYCINLDRATDRWNLCQEQFNKYNIDVERFSAIEPSMGSFKLLKGEIGCLQSHLEIIKKAKQNNYNNVLVLEDDFVFVDDFDKKFNDVIDDVPDNWNFLYFSGNHVGNLFKINENISRMTYTLTTHTYAVRSNMYDVLIPNISKMEKQVDNYYADLMRIFNAYVTIPHLTYQRTGFSYIQNREINYDFLK